MRCAVIAIGVLLAASLCAQRSPFNGIEVAPVDSSGRYRLLFSGHFHGESSNRTGLPARTLLANIDVIDDLHAHALLSTGDLFMMAADDRARYERAFFSKLRTPLFNAVGNHDLDGGDYTRLFGPTHAVIDLGKDRILVLDTERDGGSLKGEQLELLEAAATTEGLRNLFIVTHRPIWAEDDPRYGPLFRGNTRSALGTNFHAAVEPVLERLSKQVHIWWISGSMAGGAPSSIFFQPHARNITYIQSAIRDEAKDALLIAEVSSDTVVWSALSLTGARMREPRAYDAAYWEERKGVKPGFNWNLVPYWTKSMLTHRFFWWGVVLGLLFFLLLRRLLRRYP
ncbi:MAG TPA: hypothetical protein VGE21_06055 [Flavobacteriales bacterium]